MKFPGDAGACPGGIHHCAIWQGHRRGLLFYGYFILTVFHTRSNYFNATILITHFLGQVLFVMSRECVIVKLTLFCETGSLSERSGTGGNTHHDSRTRGRGERVLRVPSNIRFQHAHAAFVAVCMKNGGCV